MADDTKDAGTPKENAGKDSPPATPELSESLDKILARALTTAGTYIDRAGVRILAAIDSRFTALEQTVAKEEKKGDVPAEEKK